MENTPRDTGESMTSEARMYVYATEMVSEYYSRMDLANTSVLTVIGSGDQMINAYFFGAKQVTGFDVNTRSLLFADLKMTAVRELPYREFLSFFGDHFDNASFDFSLYNQFREILQKDTQTFFDDLYRQMPGEHFLGSGYFRERPFLTLSIVEVNAYLRNEESYTLTKERILHREPKLIACNVTELSVALQNEHVDIINLSNIPGYFVGTSEKRVEDFVFLLRQLADLISTKGLIFFYSYSPTIYSDTAVPLASGDDVRKRIEDLKIFEVREESFKAIGGEGEDAVVILVKR